jgi:hypothetical protein
VCPMWSPGFSKALPGAGPHAREDNPAWTATGKEGRCVPLAAAPEVFPEPVFPNPFGGASIALDGRRPPGVIYWTMIVVLKFWVRPRGNVTRPTMVYVPGASGSVR